MAVNNIMVTLIPKRVEVKDIKDYLPISCCTTIYKIISKILTAGIGKVRGSIMNQNQVTLVPRQHIYDHIIMAS